MKENAMAKANAREACFDAIYKLIHDENMQCTSLAAMIDIEFPDTDADVDVIGACMHEAIKPYLIHRAQFGKGAMDLMYQLAEIHRRQNEAKKYD